MSSSDSSSGACLETHQGPQDHRYCLWISFEELLCHCPCLQLHQVLMSASSDFFLVSCHWICQALQDHWCCVLIAYFVVRSSLLISYRDLIASAAPGFAFLLFLLLGAFQPFSSTSHHLSLMKRILKKMAMQTTVDRPTGWCVCWNDLQVPQDPQRVLLLSLNCCCCCCCFYWKTRTHSCR
jgi:hypothetical protein